MFLNQCILTCYRNQSTLTEIEVPGLTGNSEKCPSVSIHLVSLSDDPVAPRSQRLVECSGSQVPEVLVSQQNLVSLAGEFADSQLDIQLSVSCSHLVTELSSSNLRDGDHRLCLLVQPQAGLHPPADGS